MDDQKDVQDFVQELDGRIWNKTSNLYGLPAVADKDERARLDVKHEWDYLALNGLLPCSPQVTDALLAPVGDLPKRILDVGCGTGRWALEMAKAYPHAEVQGIDLVPVTMLNAPSNLRFSVVDVNKGLSGFRDQYDLVHARSMTTATANFPKTFLEFQQCLKPGGMLMIIDGRHNTWDDDERRVPMAKLEGDEDVSTVSEDGSMFGRLFWESIMQIKMAGADVERSIYTVEHGMWNEPLMDPDTARVGNTYVPVGPWTQNPDLAENSVLKRVGTLVLQMVQNSRRARHVLLHRAGIPQEMLDQWSIRTEEELSTMKHHMHLRYAYCWARRRASEGQPAPPLPKWDDSMKVLSSKSPSVKYPLTRIYTTAEEARLAYEKRESSIGEWPTPYVQRFAAAQGDSEKKQMR